MDLLLQSGSLPDKVSVRFFTSKIATNFFFWEGRIRSGVRASSLNEFRTAVQCRQAFENVFTYVNGGGDLPGLVQNGTVNATEKEVKERSGWTVCGWV